MFSTLTISPATYCNPYGFLPPSAFYSTAPPPGLDFPAPGHGRSPLILIPISLVEWHFGVLRAAHELAAAQQRFLNDSSTVDLDEMHARNGGTQSMADYKDEMMKYRRMNIETKSDEWRMIGLNRRRNAFLDHNWLDLHFLPAVVAMHELDNRIREIKTRPDIRPDTVVYVCTGWGRNSVNNNNISAIKTRILERCFKEQQGVHIDFHPNEGVLRLTIPR